MDKNKQKQTREPAVALLPREFYQRPVLEVARALVGRELCWRGCGGRIVETEAYSAVGDEASHIFQRPSTRVFLAKASAGHAYVYFNYGVHWMLNVVVIARPKVLLSPENGIILFRALEPTYGIATMQARRKQTRLEALCSGPGKLTQALGVVRGDHGLDLCADGEVGGAISKPLSTNELAGVVVRDGESGGAGEPLDIATDRRIGITRAVELPWRFVVRGSPFLSRPLSRK